MLFQAFLFLAQTPAPGGQPVAPPSFPWPMLVAMGVIFYFLLIRPQQKRQKDLRTLVDSLKTGDKVVTTGGIHGIVANIKDGTTLSLKVADNVRIEVDKSAIATVDRGTSATPAVAAKA